MHIFTGKTHHFTKRELAIEEIAIIVIICTLITAACLAASALLPVRVNLVQCGARADLPVKCREDRRCCALLEQRGGILVPGADKEPAESRNSGDSPDAVTLEKEHTVIQ